MTLYTTHVLGIEETATGAVTYTLVLDDRGKVIIRRKRHDLAWRNVASEVIPPEEFTTHVIKGQNLETLVAKTMAELRQKASRQQR